MAGNVVVASYSFWQEAQIARASLDAAGIPAVLADEHTINMDWLYSNALGGVRVMVPPQHYEEANRILSTDYSAAVEQECGPDETACPSCGGKNNVPYTLGKKPAFVVWLLLGFPLLFCKHGMKCDDCGKFWADDPV